MKSHAKPLRRKEIWTKIILSVVFCLIGSIIGAWIVFPLGLSEGYRMHAREESLSAKRNHQKASQRNDAEMMRYFEEVIAWNILGGLHENDFEPDYLEILLSSDHTYQDSNGYIRSKGVSNSSEFIHAAFQKIQESK